MSPRSLCPAILLFVGSVACGESTPPRSDAATTTPDVNISACGAIGMPCSNSCPNGLECIADACAPLRGDCGGFTGAECQDTSLTCAYPMSSSAGICLRPDEKACLCAIAPNALTDCVQP